MITSAIQACGNAGHWERALALLDGDDGDPGVSSSVQAAVDGENNGNDKMSPPARPWSLGACGAAMEALSAASRWTECLSLLERMRDAGVQPDAGLYGSVLHALQQAGEWGSVYELLYTMRAEGVTTADTMLPYHKNLWKRARKELGF
jgi:pentatricopeptide repeat protein